MFTFNQLRAYFWNVDPGYFNLKQALKTILAILISLWFVRDESLLTQLMAGMASGFSMQGVLATTWLYRIAYVFVFDVLCFTAFALGLAVRDSANATAVMLVALGFFANYIRRFGLDLGVAPLMAWSLGFLATILPFSSSIDAWSHIYGLFIGFLVSAIVIIFVFPENYPRLFINNSNRFFKTMAQGMREIRQYILAPNVEIDVKDLPFMQTKIK